MRQSTLTSAAVALSTVLTSHRISHAFFGGWAVIAKGADRESKDLDVLVKAEKDDIVNLLTKGMVGLKGEDVGTWMVIPQSRSDYVAFFWKATPTSTEMVLVELFIGTFKLSTISSFGKRKTNSSCLGPKTKIPSTVSLIVDGVHAVPVIDTPSLFRGKLSACAFRSKPNDCSDLIFLATSCAHQLPSDTIKKIDTKVIGMAIKRYPDLIESLEGLGISTRKAIKKVGSSDSLSSNSSGFSISGRMNEGEVQRGLFC
ncbi:hypothetical protein Dda_1067 [Drechslerella dactyloides]|uniref:Nucleotidyl transferase n=1 Tax=Drechslerella dactyloides TaxID=74499 RepID=A0AAD6J5N2_DREDA|nr:hypothetical protein Dda_1067 [Drechslerella dactyloides]